MSVPLVTQALLDRIIRFGVRANVDRAQQMAALPGNPLGAEVCHFGSAAAVKFRSPVLRGKNRVFNLDPQNLAHLDEILHYYRAEGLRCALQWRNLGLDPEIVRQLAERQVFVTGTAGAYYGAPHPGPQLPEKISIRRLKEVDLTEFLDLFLAANEIPSSRQHQVRQFEILENTQPGYRLFIAALDGTPAAVGSLNIRDGIGSLVAAATLPAFRRQGCQAALLQRRLDEAHAAGCDLVIGHAALFSPSQRNLERAGLRPVHFGLSLSDGTPL